jgi:NAD(P)-dependent dehydrogenase (short-subunit alcohol dehydrogenase family)
MEEAAKCATDAPIADGRIGRPEDLVCAVLFLVSDESRWVTRNTIVVNGAYLVI